MPYLSASVMKLPCIEVLYQVSFTITFVFHIIRMQVLESKISSHCAETPDSVMELKAEVDALHEKLEVCFCIFAQLISK